MDSVDSVDSSIAGGGSDMGLRTRAKHANTGALILLRACGMSWQNTSPGTRLVGSLAV